MSTHRLSGNRKSFNISRDSRTQWGKLLSFDATAHTAATTNEGCKAACGYAPDSHEWSHFTGRV